MQPKHPFAYRPDIDGLRAAAVLLVAAYHYFPKYWGGGFLGVNIFFVISGFLITGIIRQQLEAGRLSLTDFYLRRIRRIFPALLVVLIATVAVGYWMFLSSELKEFGRTLEAAAVFVPNLYFWQHTGYFDVAIHKQPLMHLWSLGVEEQFYLVWPLLLLAVKRLRIPAIPVILLLGALSFAFAATRPETVLDRTYYLPHFHAWELAVGALLAFLPHRLSRSWAEISAWLGAGLLAAGVGWSGLYGAMLPPVIAAVAGAALLILSGAGTIPGKVLGTSLAAAFGRRSYLLYLWHWPLLCIAQIISVTNEVSPAQRWLLAGAAILLAEFTFRFVECPTRSRRLVVSFPLAGAMTAMMAMGFAMAGGVLKPRSDSFPRLHAFEQQRIGYLVCARSREQGKAQVCDLAQEKSEVLFWGDSNAIQYAPRAEKLWKENPGRALATSFINAPACPPISGLSAGPYAGCEASEKFFGELAADPQVKRIVLAAQWLSYLIGNEAPTSGEGTGNAEEMQMLESFERFIRAWRAAGKEVVVILSTPYWPPMPQFLVKRSVWEPWTIEGAAWSRTLWDKRRLSVMSEVRHHAEAAGARVIDPTMYVCDEVACPAMTMDGMPIYVDADHLSYGYVRERVTYLDELILRKGSTK